MYCNQCGKEIIETSKFCNNCGTPVPEEDAIAPTPQPPSNAVEDLQKKLREIDNRKKPPAPKSAVLKSALDVVKGKTSVSDLIFGESFEGKKLADKRKLILDYPLPTSPKDLEHFAKYINSEIELKKTSPDVLTDVWKEKLKQVYSFAQAHFEGTNELAEIQKCYRANKRREQRAAIREWLLPLSLFIAAGLIASLIVSIVFHWPWLLFISILGIAWGLFGILYVNDLLDNAITSVKEHSKKLKGIPKRLQSVAWHLLIPFLAALITALAYFSTPIIILFSILFGIDALFVLIILSYIYD